MKNKNNKIACVVSGELCYISEERRAKLVKKHGSVKKLKESYISRDAKTLRKLGASDLEIRELDKKGRTSLISTLKNQKEALKKPRKKRKKKVKVNGKAINRHNVPVYQPKPRRFCTQEQLAEITESSCLSPGLYLDNLRSCDGCKHYEYCRSHLRQLDSQTTKKKARKTRRQKGLAKTR